LYRSLVCEFSSGNLRGLIYLQSFSIDSFRWDIVIRRVCHPQHMKVGIDVGYVCPHGREVIGCAGAPGDTSKSSEQPENFPEYNSSAKRLHREKDSTFKDPFSRALRTTQDRYRSVPYLPVRDQQILPRVADQLLVAEDG
jgi:hypothetical protein